VTARPYALITGACGGIGRALVEAFQAAGYHVIATDVVPAPTAFQADDFVCADLARTVQDETYADMVFAELRGLLDCGGLSVLVNNAAIQILRTVDELSRSDWRTTLDINLLAPFFWTQTFLPELESAAGTVINISSIHARLTKPNFVAYGLSKAALSALTRNMAVELGSRVRVNAIEPAAVDTEMLRAGFGSSEAAYRQLERCHPAGRIISPHEVAGLAVWLASDHARSLTGVCLGLDGGIGSRLHDPA
jgi:NAD(P)-dependent dehydrogenase (short-subunit alcohol dehydrogenase family)